MIHHCTIICSHSFSFFTLHPTSLFFFFFFFNDTATTEIYTLSLHDALPIWIYFDGPGPLAAKLAAHYRDDATGRFDSERSEEHTSELQSLAYLVCRLLLEKKKKKHQ